MKLIKQDNMIPQIDLYTENGNWFGYINMHGTLTLKGEDSHVWKDELKEIAIISNNFDLFFNNIKTEL